MSGMARLPLLLPAAGLLLLLLLGSVAPHVHACTSIIVSAGATTDGSVLIARNDDGEDYHTPNNLVYHPPRAEPAVFQSNMNKLRIELPAPGLAYFSLPSNLGDSSKGRNVSSEAAGVNSAGVAVSATESIYNSAAALKADPYAEEVGVLEDALPSLLLPQASSAREGMQLLGELVESHGAGEGYGVLIADSREAWYIETAGGHHWMAQRVPHGAFFVTGNQGRFQEANLSDTANVMSSPGLEAYAIRAGLYDPSTGKPFNFFKAFTDNPLSQLTYSIPRVRKLQELYAGAAVTSGLQELSGGGLLPVFMEPSRKLEVGDVMAGLRNHFDGSNHDPYTHMNPQEPFRPIAVLRSGMGHITRLRPAGVPAGLAAIQYVAMTMPALSPFIPIYQGLPPEALPRQLTCARDHPDPHSLFWKARRLQALVFQDWPTLAPPAADAIRQWESEIRARRVPPMEARYAEAIASGDEVAAQGELVGFTEEVVRQAGELLDKLTRQAAGGLGLRGVPHDAELVRMLDEALAAYGFEPPSNSNALRWQRAHSAALSAE